LFIKWDTNQNNRLEIDELPNGARENFKFADQNNDQHISLAEHINFLSGKRKIKVISNLSYGKTSNARQTLDIFIPLNYQNKKPLPLVIWIHGGGWKNGSKKTGHLPSRLPAIVQTGNYIGASIGYRLSNEKVWPAQIHDCKAAIRWLRANAKKYGIDADRFAVWGASAGGHLASMLGVSANNKDLEGSIGTHLDQSSHVNAVVNYYGPSALLTMNDYPSKIDHNSPNSPESQLLGYPIQENKKLTQKASPLYYVSPKDPPFISFHGTMDSLVPYNQTKVFHQALLDKSVKSVLITLREGGHSMPLEFTQKFVIPFLDNELIGRGKPLKSQNVTLK
jgi:acetyl esterase/lipase